MQFHQPRFWYGAGDKRRSSDYVSKHLKVIYNLTDCSVQYISFFYPDRYNFISTK